jgi:tetratricopeptide (TPR) repeat protein
MNKTEFIQLIQNPELLTAKHVAALKQMVIDFPYNTHARVLLAKALFNEKHYDYDKFLKQTALAVPDRDVLYHYLHDLTPQWQIPQQQFVVTPPISDPPSIPIASSAINNAVEEEEKVLESTLKQEQRPEVTEPKVEEVEEESKEEAAVAGIEEDVEVQQTKDELDVDLAISTLLEETQVTTPTAPIIEETKVEEITLTKTVELVDSIEPQNVPEERTVADADENEEDEELSFVEWLQRKNNPKTENKPDDKASSDLKPLEVTPNTEETKTEEVAVAKQEPIEVAKPEVEKTALPTATVEVTKEEIEKAVAKSNINDFHNILDKFIKENPSISRPKAEFFNPVNMARQSVEEDEELVTETLANLYYKQGNHKKAIRAYEKLCLLYPSKMSYFASLIQKIKTEIKD